MTDLTRICIVSSAETALRKLKKAEIGVYDCKKQGASFIFSVKDKQLKKVFAIFSKPCYNIKVHGKSRRTQIKYKLLMRIGLLIGSFIFVAAAAISNSLILKISVTGSGKYLSSEVKRIIYSSGVKEFKPYKKFDVPTATGKILSLPQVTFCNIQKRGSVLLVDVEVDEENSLSSNKNGLISDRDGVIKSITALCGTANFKAGDAVKKGDELISPVTLAGEEYKPTLAVGYAQLICKGSVSYFAQEESDENLKYAYDSCLISAENIVSRTHSIKLADGGVMYIIDFTYLHKLNININ